MRLRAFTMILVVKMLQTETNCCCCCSCYSSIGQSRQTVNTTCGITSLFFNVVNIIATICWSDARCSEQFREEKKKKKIKDESVCCHKTTLSKLKYK